MSAPRLTIGLPVYNGEDYLPQTLDAILGQTFGDFELVISSNASTDSTDEICRSYAERDARIRLIRQPTNIGAVPNHYVLVDAARGELFKWAGADDLWARELVERCVELLDANPDAVLAHTWTAAIDADCNLIQAHEYPLATDSPDPVVRLRSMLYAGDELPGAIRADDFYGVMRTDFLRRMKPHDSYHHADQTFMVDLALYGRFVEVPEWLYFRRHHPGRAHESKRSIRSWCVNLDPRRSNPVLNPAVRLVAEYVWGYFDAVHRAPLTRRQKRACYRVIVGWLAGRVARRVTRRDTAIDEARVNRVAAQIPVRSLVSGQQAHG